MCTLYTLYMAFPKQTPVGVMFASLVVRIQRDQCFLSLHSLTKTVIGMLHPRILCVDRLSSTVCITFFSGIPSVIVSFSDPVFFCMYSAVVVHHPSCAGRGRALRRAPRGRAPSATPTFHIVVARYPLNCIQYAHFHTRHTCMSCSAHNQAHTRLMIVCTPRT